LRADLWRMKQEACKAGLVHQRHSELVGKDDLVGYLITGYSPQCRAAIAQIPQHNLSSSADWWIAEITDVKNVPKNTTKKRQKT